MDNLERNYGELFGRDEKLGTEHTLPIVRGGRRNSESC